MRTAEEIDASVDGRGPDVEDEGGGFTFETIGGLVKGRCGAPKKKAAPDPAYGPLFAAADGGIIKAER
jgi:hypothetical protein